VQLASPFALKSEVQRAATSADRGGSGPAAAACAVQLASRFGLERDTRLPGSFVYALAEGGGVGSLCQVTSDDGEELVVEYWRLDLTKAARKVEEAARFLRQTTLERASEVVASGPAVKGSLVKRAHLFEKLSDARLAMIDLCISGKCGVDHDETSTACLSGCGRRLHVETCAQMGRGFAALGNFRCVDCRLKELVVPGSRALVPSQGRQTPRVEMPAPPPKVAPESG
jgi:hypothetical protein